MVTGPAATPVATFPAIVALVMSEESQLAVPVKSCVVASLKLPVAVNDCDPLTTTPGPIGLIAMLSRRAVTVRVLLPEIGPKAALMVVCPPCSPVTRPPLVMVALDVSDEPHTTLLVRFF